MIKKLHMKQQNKNHKTILIIRIILIYKEKLILILKYLKMVKENVIFEKDTITNNWGINLKIHLKKQISYLTYL